MSSDEFHKTVNTISFGLRELRGEWPSRGWRLTRRRFEPKVWENSDLCWITLGLVRTMHHRLYYRGDTAVSYWQTLHVLPCKLFDLLQSQHSARRFRTLAQHLQQGISKEGVVHTSWRVRDLKLVGGAKQCCSLRYFADRCQFSLWRFIPREGIGCGLRNGERPRSHPLFGGRGGITAIKNRKLPETSKLVQNFSEALHSDTGFHLIHLLNGAYGDQVFFVEKQPVANVVHKQVSLLLLC